MTGILQQIMNTMEQTRSASVLDSVSTIGFAALFVLGVINCVLGYRLLRFWMMLFGFLIGGGIGLGVAYTMGIQEKYMYAVIMIGVGILLAVLAFLSYKVGIFIIGAGIGEYVLVAQGSAARIGCGVETAPVDAAIVGIVDDGAGLE